VIAFTESFLGEEEAGLSPGEYASLLGLFMHQPVVRIGEDAAREIGELAGKMLNEYNNYFLLRSEMLRWYAKIFLIHVRRQLNAFQPGADPRPYPTLEQKLKVAYSFDFEDIAHFGKFFKNTAGANFTDIRRDTAPPHMPRA
jgi:hypothetical protein